MKKLLSSIAAIGLLAAVSANATIVTNGSFEVGTVGTSVTNSGVGSNSSLTGWRLYNQVATVTNIATLVSGGTEGSQAVQLTTIAGAGGGNQSGIDNLGILTPVSPGQISTFAVDVKRIAGGALTDFRFIIFQYDAGGVLQGTTSVITPYAGVTTDYQTISTNLTLSAATTKVRFSLRMIPVGAAGATATLELDNVRVFRWAHWS